MDDLEQTLEVARALSEHGLTRSALRLLDESAAVGYRMNSARARYRRLSAEPTIPAGIYAVGTIAGTAIVLPVSASPGQTFNSGYDEESRDACEVAADVVERRLERPGTPFPSFAVSLPSRIFVSGRSLGLAAALEIARRACGLAVTAPVVATGELTRNGSVLDVDFVKRKLEAAFDELRGRDGIVLCPNGNAYATVEGSQLCRVASFSEALRAVWGDVPLRVAPTLLAVESLIAESRAEQDHRAAIRVLESRPFEDLPTVDRARLLLEIGTRLRHTGDVERAFALHAEVERLLPEILAVEGRTVVESMLVELVATQVGTFQIEAAEKRLRTMLGAGFEMIHNRVRCQGMLAQVLSTLGRHEEVITLRESNLELQRQSDAMRREIPRTLASLVYEAARAGRNDVFDRYLPVLFETTRPGDHEQIRYNDAAIVRGLVLLGRSREFLGWLRGTRSLLNTLPSAGLLEIFNGNLQISTHPEVSTSRCLARALLAEGSVDAAARIVSRVSSSPADVLVHWFGSLCTLEMEMFYSGSVPSERALTTISSLRNSHSSAFCFYFPPSVFPITCATIGSVLRDCYY
jgi:hypothetical protein